MQDFLSGPYSWNGVAAKFAFSFLDLNFFYLVTDPMDNLIFTLGAVCAFCSVAGDVSQVDVMKSFIESDVISFFKGR